MVSTSNTTDVVFETDGFFTSLVLILLFGTIVILLILDGIGYIHYQKEEGFTTTPTPTQTNHPLYSQLGRSRTLSVAGVRRNCDFERIRGGSNNVINRPIDLTVRNPGDYMVPKKHGYYGDRTEGSSSQAIVEDKNNNSAKFIVGELDKVYSGVHELTIAEMDEILKLVGQKGISFKYEGNSDAILDVKQQILNKFNIEFVSMINHFVLSGKKNHPDHKYQYFKILSYDIRNDGNNINWDDLIFRDPPVNPRFLLSERTGFRPVAFLKNLPMFSMTDAENEERLKRNMEASGAVYQKRGPDVKDRQKLIDKMLNEDRDKYNTKDTNNFNLGENRMFITLGREGTVQNFMIYAYFTVETDVILRGRYLPDTNGMNVTINFNVLKVYGVKQKELASFDKYGISVDGGSRIEDKYFDKNYQEQEVDNYIRKLSSDDWQESHKCFVYMDDKNIELDRVRNKFFCESYQEPYAQNGVWDAPCQDDRECPFYKANKNYDNSFGGCNRTTGECQMPYGVKRVGYKKVTKDNPICYNCAGDTNTCCWDQDQKKKDQYSKMKSPDYVFDGDLASRELQAEKLRRNGCPSSLLN